MAIETRFARTPAGPVPFRVDGAGPRQLLIISDWGDPYGQPGIGAFEAFVADLSKRDAMVVTLLDGTIGSRETTPSGIERRIAGAGAVAELAELNRATILGASDGAPIAALLAAQDPTRFTRLILYDTFSAETRKGWALNPPNELGSAFAEIVEAQDQLKSAGVAFEWARGRWNEMGKRGARRDDRRPPGPLPPPNRNRSLPAFGPPPPFEGGLSQLLQHVASLESASRRGGGLSSISTPTLVIEARDDGTHENAGSLGMEVAAEIPGARHRAVQGRSRWPWGEAAAALDLLATGEPQAARPRSTPGDMRATDAPDRVLATVLFTDIVGSTERLAELGDGAWRNLLEEHHRTVRGQLARFDGREIDTAGDGFLAAFETPARGVRCAVAIRDEVREMGISVRCGLHTGECERVGDKLIGIAVHIGARITGQASADEVLVSATVRDLVAGAGITFADRGTATLKGLPGEWQLFAVSEAGSPSS